MTGKVKENTECFDLKEGLVLLRKKIIAIFFIFFLNSSKSFAIYQVAIRHAVFEKKYGLLENALLKASHYNELTFKNVEGVFVIVKIQNIEEQRKALLTLYKKFKDEISPLSKNEEGKTIFQVYLTILEKYPSKENHLKMLNFLEISLTHTSFRNEEIMNNLYEMACRKGSSPIHRRYKKLFYQLVPDFKTYPNKIESHNLPVNPERNVTSKEKEKGKRSAKIHPVLQAW